MSCFILCRAWSIHFIKCILFSLLMVYALEGQTLRQQNKDDSRIKFKVVYAHKSSIAPNILSLRIVVERRRLNKGYMLKLARSIRCKFAGEAEINAIIFDQKETAESADIEQILSRNLSVPELRGFYVLSRSRDEEYIQFSSTRENPNNEVVLKISSETCCK